MNPTNTKLLATRSQLEAAQRKDTKPVVTKTKLIPTLKRERGVKPVVKETDFNYACTKETDRTYGARCRELIVKNGATVECPVHKGSGFDVEAPFRVLLKAKCNPFWEKELTKANVRMVHRSSNRSDTLGSNRKVAAAVLGIDPEAVRSPWQEIKHGEDHDDGCSVFDPGLGSIEGQSLRGELTRNGYALVDMHMITMDNRHPVTFALVYERRRRYRVVLPFAEEREVVVCALFDTTFETVDVFANPRKNQRGELDPEGMLVTTINCKHRKDREANLHFLAFGFDEFRKAVESFGRSALERLLRPSYRLRFNSGLWYVDDLQGVALPPPPIPDRRFGKHRPDWMYKYPGKPPGHYCAHNMVDASGSSSR